MANSTLDPMADLLSGEERRELSTVWMSPGGFLRWFTHVNHKSIGRRYIITAFIFFLLGGIEALMMRAQLATAQSDLISPQLFNTLFTMHGTTMMFLFAVPMMEGLGMYLVPLMIGTRDMAFPRLNAFGYYVFLIGGVALYAAFFSGFGPDAGWFNYVPLSGPVFSPGHRIDVWLALITFIEVAALTAAVELIVTILKQRAPGMSLTRIPLFVWAMLVMSVMIVFAMPAVIVASLTLALDRLVGTHFFTVSHGGDVLLWQHLFWFFGHPEVYIMFVPALGIISAIIPVFCGRRIFGYRVLALSLVATGFISFGLWVHHMFTTGLPRMGENFFSASSMMIAIPTGVQIFCWIATIRLGLRPRFTTAMLFVLGFIAVFVAGGLTGVMLASVPFDSQVHDTYFIVAHFHYVLIGGVVFPILGALYFWMPKITGRQLSERLGRWVFGLVFVGFNVAFFPMHNLGLEGMPRRVYTYAAGLGWEPLNLLSTFGAVLLGAGVALFAFDFLRSLRPAASAADPWSADSLEWLAGSPPAAFNFAAIPVVDDRHPLWSSGPVRVAGGLLTSDREVLVTTLLEARPHHTMRLPGPTYWPFIMAVTAAVGFVGAIFTPWAVVASVFLTFLALVGWFWPRNEELELRWEGRE